MQLCTKFGNFLVNIHGDIICQCWLLWALFFNFPIVHWLCKSSQTLYTSLTVQYRICRISCWQFNRVSVNFRLKHHCESESNNIRAICLSLADWPPHLIKPQCTDYSNLQHGKHLFSNTCTKVSYMINSDITIYLIKYNFTQIHSANTGEFTQELRFLLKNLQKKDPRSNSWLAETEHEALVGSCQVYCSAIKGEVKKVANI